MNTKDTAAINAALAQRYVSFLEETTDSPQPLAEQPEAKELIAALQEICPAAKPGGMLVNMFLAFCGGFDAGLECARRMATVAGEGAQA